VGEELAKLQLKRSGKFLNNCSAPIKFLGREGLLTRFQSSQVCAERNTIPGVEWFSDEREAFFEKEGTNSQCITPTWSRVSLVETLFN